MKKCPIPHKPCSGADFGRQNVRGQERARACLCGRAPVREKGRPQNRVWGRSWGEAGIDLAGCSCKKLGCR